MLRVKKRPYGGKEVMYSDQVAATNAMTECPYGDKVMLKQRVVRLELRAVQLEMRFVR